MEAGDGKRQGAARLLLHQRRRFPAAWACGLVDEGNIVQANSTSPFLVVITQLQPITVIFSIAEDHLPIIQAQLKGGKHIEAVDALRPGAGPTNWRAGSFLTDADNLI